MNSSSFISRKYAKAYEKAMDRRAVKHEEFYDIHSEDDRTAAFMTLLECVKKGDVSGAADVLNEGYHIINDQDQYGETALYKALKKTSVDEKMVRLLFVEGANANILPEEYDQVLDLVPHENTDILEILIDNFANVYEDNIEGYLSALENSTRENYLPQCNFYCFESALRVAKKMVKSYEKRCDNPDMDKIEEYNNKIRELYNVEELSYDSNDEDE